MINAGYRFGIITRRYDGEIHHLIRRFRKGSGITTFYADELVKIRDFLKKGGTIGMMVDGKNIESRMAQARRLSQAFKAPIIKGALIPVNGTFYLSTNNIDFTELVLRYPEHYAWFYLTHN